VRRLTVVVTFAVLGLLLCVTPASAQTGQPVLDRAASALRSSPVYVDPERAGDVDRAAANRLRERIADRGAPVFLAVLPAGAIEEAGGDANAVVEALARKVRLSGTYGVVAGNSFRAGSTNLAPGRAGSAATAAFQAHRDEGIEAVLADFVDRAAAAQGGSRSGEQNGSGSGEGDSGTFGGGESSGDRGSDAGGSLLPVVLLLGVGGGGLYLWQRGRQRRERTEEREEAQADLSLLRAEVSVLAQDVMQLEPQIALHPEARDDYEAAVARYRVAQAALEQNDPRIDLVRVERVVNEGQYAMARARAIIDGRQPPPPPESLTRRGRHDEPPVDLDDEGRPAYVGYGSPFYGGGWFGGGGGLLTGLFLGQMLGGWGGWGGHQEQNVYVDGGGDDAGGGDWGGGDWGGGDWGGGDWGGDIGGGDW
jgi:hypothetical protein